MYEVQSLKDELGTLREPVLIVGFAVRRRGGRLARWALEHHRSAAGRADYPVQGNPPGELGNYEPGL